MKRLLLIPFVIFTIAEAQVPRHLKNPYIMADTLVAGSVFQLTDSTDLSGPGLVAGDTLASRAYARSVGIDLGTAFNATYITQTPSSILTAEQALSALSTGLMKSTTGTGIISIAIAGTDFQSPDADLTAIAALSGTGFAVRSASNTWVQRSIAAGYGIDVSNGDGISGNPTVTVDTTDKIATLYQLSLKAPLASPAFTGTVTSGDTLITDVLGVNATPSLFNTTGVRAAVYSDVTSENLLWLYTDGSNGALFRSAGGSHNRVNFSLFDGTQEKIRLDPSATTWLGTDGGINFGDTTSLGGATTRFRFTGRNTSVDLVEFKSSNGTLRAKIDSLGGATFTDKGGEVYNVKSYGAVGDGVTNDGTAIHAARTAAGARTVYFPAGTYLVGTLTANVANQTWELDEGATIKLADATNSYIINVTADNFTLRGGILDGNASNQTTNNQAINCYDYDGLTIDGATITNVKGTAIFLLGQTSYVENVKIINSTIQNTQKAAIDLRSVKNIKIDNNNFTAWSLAGADSASAIVISPGTMGDTSFSLFITDNEFDNTVGEHFGIEATNTGYGRVVDGATITGNVFRGNGLSGNGISGYFFNTTFDDNKHLDGSGSHRSGYEIVGQTVNITNNILKNGTVVVSTATGGTTRDIIIKGNNISNSANYGSGIQLGNSDDVITDVLIEGNEIRLTHSTPQSAVYLGTYGTTGQINRITVRGNKLYSDSAGTGNGIRLLAAASSSDITITGNEAHGFDTGFLSAADGNVDEVTLAWNDFRDNTTPVNNQATGGTYRVGSNYTLDDSDAITFPDSVSAARFIASTQFLAPVGSASAPAYSFTGTTNTGFYLSGAGGRVVYSQSGTAYIQFNGDSFELLTNSGFLAIGGTSLYRDAAHVFAQRNGTNAQGFRVYNTHTDASNYERGNVSWSANRFLVGTSNSGTGVSRDLVFTTTGTARWSVGGSTGHLLAETNNTPNIGSSTGNRVASIFAQNSLNVQKSDNSYMFVADTTGTTIGSSGTELTKVVGASLVYDSGSIAAGVDSTFNITVTGAVAGNPVQVGVSVASEEGLIITAQCTTNDVVTVRLANHLLVSAIDPATRTYKVIVTNF